MDPVVIIGAGPAGVAAALELAQSDVPVVLLERTDRVGGLACTHEFHGARFDVGPHRFFTKNLEIQRLWRETLGDDFIDVERLTRIFYRGEFLDYPLSVADTLRKVGPLQAASFALSYLGARTRTALGRSEPTTFEDWVSSRFGRSLFEAFFRTYTEKVWGIPCAQLSADWAAQRIKGLSLREALRSTLSSPGEQEQTLVTQFQYPRGGAGRMYERMAARAQAHGAQLLLKTRAVGIRREQGRAVAVSARSRGTQREIPCSHVLTSNPILEVVETLEPAPPDEVLSAARALRYRCHLCVNLLVEAANGRDQGSGTRGRQTADGDGLFPDNWIYVHATEVKLGRVANYANFDRGMCGPTGQQPITAEYFQFPDDELYRNRDDSALVEFARGELQAMGIVDPDQVRGGFVVRNDTAYPVLEVGYQRHVEVLRRFLDTVGHLQPIGRGGMFKYNNQDHSIATGLLAARNILGAQRDVWAVNIDAEYHEG